ncbi:hypothetical protein JXB01_02790 [Candidatus Micrarchaeota archaeon]|nr:hypothetical protein [Candidatus Micrarchaeota archaeon]
MTSLDTIKRLASDILGVGVKRVKFKKELSEDERRQVEESITRQNVRDLIQDKIITAKREKGRVSKPKKKKTTKGRRKGKKHSKLSQKEKWMERVRAQRKYLAKLVADGKLERGNRKDIYLKIKGGQFRSISALNTYLKDNKLVKE